MFRNLTFLQFPTTLDLSGIEDALAECTLRPVGPLETSSRGWVPPYGAGDDRLVQRIGNTLHLVLGGEDKVLPPSAVQRELAKRLDKLEQEDGRKLGGKARKRLKDEVLQDLLQRALVKPYRLAGYLDLHRGLLVVDTASRNAAEEFATELRRALGSFPALPLNPQLPPRGVLTGRLAGEGLPGHLVLGEDCTLADAADGGAVVRFQREDLLGEEVQRHLEAGKQCTSLGLFDGDRLAFTLGEDLVVRKLRFLDGAMDALEGEESDDLAAELDARAALLVGEVGRLFDVLQGAFRLAKVEG